MEYNQAPIHLQVWASNVSFDKPRRLYGSGHTEVAWTADVLGSVTREVKYDAGLNYFTYPGLTPNADFGELFATVSFGQLSTTAHFSRNYDNLRPWRSGTYLEVNRRWKMGASGFNVLAHVGASWGTYWSAFNGGSYLDYAVGAERQINTVDLSVRLVGTHGYVAIPYGQPLSGKARIVLSLSYAPL